MTIHLPYDLETSIQTAVRNGRFASVDDAMAEAARLLLREISQGQPPRNAAGMGSIFRLESSRDRATTESRFWFCSNEFSGLV